MAFNQKQLLALYFVRHFNNALQVNNLSLPGAATKYICGTGNGGFLISYTGNDLLSYVHNNNTYNIKLNDDFSEGVKYILPMPHRNFIILGNGIAHLSLKTLQVKYSPIYQSAKDICLYNDSILLLSESVHAIALKASVLLKKSSKAVLEETSLIFFRGRASALAVFPDKSILIGTPNGLLRKSGLKGAADKVPHETLKEANITDITVWRHHYALISTHEKQLQKRHLATLELEAIITNWIIPRHINTLIFLPDS